MNETVNKFLLAGDKFMPEMHLKQKTDYNAKINRIKGKIPSIAGLATTAALNTDCDAKISGIESKYFTATCYNEFTSQALNAIKIK